MGVREEHGIDLGNIIQEDPVFLVALLAFPLEHAAFEEDLLAIDRQQVLRSGDGLRPAEKLKLHIDIVLVKFIRIMPASRSRPVQNNGLWNPPVK